MTAVVELAGPGAEWRLGPEPGDEEVLAALGAHGLAVVAGDDQEHFVARVGRLGRARDHAGPGSAVWHIRSLPGGVARSHTGDEFGLHTDCSYDQDRPPTHLAMHVIRADRLGGGVSRLVHLDEVLARLGADHARVLHQPLPIVVPGEFATGGPAVVWAPVLGPDGVRFRHELLGPEASGAQRRAVDAFARAAEDSPALVGVLEAGTTVVVDNRRWLHARSAVADARRHLLRIRFDLEPAALR